MAGATLLKRAPILEADKLATGRFAVDTDTDGWEQLSGERLTALLRDIFDIDATQQDVARLQIAVATHTPQLYTEATRPTAATAYASLQRYGNGNCLWLLPEDQSAQANRPGDADSAYFQNRGQVRSVPGPVIATGAQADRNTRLQEGTLLRLVREFTYTDGDGVSQTVETTLTTSCWSITGILWTRETAPYWEYSADGERWTTPPPANARYARENKKGFGGRSLDVTSIDAQISPTFALGLHIERVTAPQLYAEATRPTAATAYASLQQHGSGNCLWLLPADQSAQANRPGDADSAYFQNREQVRSVTGAVIATGAQADRNARLQEGTLLRLVSGFTYTDGDGVSQTVETTPTTSCWSLTGILWTRETAPYWEYSADGESWTAVPPANARYARENKKGFGGRSLDVTSIDAQISPTFVLETGLAPALTAQFGLADATNNAVGTAEVGTLDTTWDFPPATPTAPKQYFNVPIGKRVTSILNVALGGRVETLAAWQAVTAEGHNRYVRQVRPGREGQYRVIFEDA